MNNITRDENSQQQTNKELIVKTNYKTKTSETRWIFFCIFLFFWPSHIYPWIQEKKTHTHTYNAYI